MTAFSARRGFLSGLVGLPLIGGGVTLVGSPTAAAVPITNALLDAYDEWLDLERSFLKWERYGPEGFERPERTGVDVVFRNRHTDDIFDFVPKNIAITPHGGSDRPSTRAAVVLSAAGASVREGRLRRVKKDA